MEAKIKHIENLLEAYFEGNTSLQEEKALREYFSTESVAPHLEVYRPLFEFIQQENRETLNLDATEEVFVFRFPTSAEAPRKKFVIRWGSVAATLILFLTISGIFFQRHQQQQMEEAELAFAQTKQALLKVSSEFNTALQNLEHLQELDQTTPFFNLNNK